eukprot:6976681-Ditylum_brightwellii.AAC.1
MSKLCDSDVIAKQAGLSGYHKNHDKNGPSTDLQDNSTTISPALCSFAIQRAQVNSLSKMPNDIPRKKLSANQWAFSPSAGIISLPSTNKKGEITTWGSTSQDDQGKVSSPLWKVFHQDSKFCCIEVREDHAK